MKRQTRVYLYAEPKEASLDLSALRDYVKSLLPPLDVVIRPGFIGLHLNSPSGPALTGLATDFASAKVRNPNSPDLSFVPLLGEIDFERRRLTDPENRAWGILYDGYRMMGILQRLIPETELSLPHIHVVFTNQLFGTWNDSDRRYHARASLYGFPSILSTTGIVVAPAKPREYYVLKQQYSALGMQDATDVELDRRFAGQFIAIGDARLTEAMKGYVMQAITHRFWGDPFCDDASCRLYNAHWQKEVISAQIEGPNEFCPIHQEKLRELREALPA